MISQELNSIWEKQGILNSQRFMLCIKMIYCHQSITAIRKSFVSFSRYIIWCNLLIWITVLKDSRYFSDQQDQHGINSFAFLFENTTYHPPDCRHFERQMEKDHLTAYDGCLWIISIEWVGIQRMVNSGSSLKKYRLSLIYDWLFNDHSKLW